MATVRLSDLQQALRAVDYPAGKEQLLRHAELQAAGEDVRRALRSLPPVSYRDFDEVARSVDSELGSGPAPARHADPADKPSSPRVTERLR
ncbi:MAG: DUF2795 domain-containing protein [Actinomycetota bacterium]|nr:DUF2795 domain-containing protein [Actinomycetota bacterium]